MASKSVLGAGFNVLSAVLIRAMSFLVNAFIIRIVAPESLGLINVRLPLLYSTVLFLSREAFRKACLQAPPNHLWPARINLLWLCLPLSIVLSFLLGWVWLHVLDCPLDLMSQYRPSVLLICLSVVLNVAVEPFYIVGQTQLWLAFFSLSDLMATWVQYLTFLSLIFFFDMGNEPVLASAYAFVVSAIFFDVVVIVYFHRKMRLLPSNFVSLINFLPNVDKGLDTECFKLTLGFFKQGFVKQLLTEGEQYVFTWSRLMSLGEQSVYNIVANLGAIPARLVFAKVEETAYVYFSQTIKRGDESGGSEEQSINVQLRNLLRAAILMGLLLCGFGFSFSHLLLYLYGGSRLAEMGTQLLRSECFYLLFMAVNGISECFAFCIMSETQIEMHNYFMTALSIGFLTLTYILAKMFGPLGFVMANCCNFALRIVYNFKLIKERHNKKKVANTQLPTANLSPSVKTLVVLTLATSVCVISERFVYKNSDVASILAHLAIGLLSGLITVTVILHQERYVRDFVLSLWNKSKRD